MSKRKFEERIEKSTGISVPKPLIGEGRIKTEIPKPMGAYSGIIKKPQPKPQTPEATLPNLDEVIGTGNKG